MGTFLFQVVPVLNNFSIFEPKDIEPNLGPEEFVLGLRCDEVAIGKNPHGIYRGIVRQSRNQLF